MITGKPTKLVRKYIRSIGQAFGGKNQQSKSSDASANFVSIVVVAYNVGRELPKTLTSLSSSYQVGVQDENYEVVVVDNGSNPPVDPKLVAQYGSNFRTIRISKPSLSPVPAVNAGIEASIGESIGVLIDGARIVTPGLVNFARIGLGMAKTPVVVAPGWYLGSDLQGYASKNGYTQQIEDNLLLSINWPESGYRLFEISTMDESSTDPWFSPLSEANAIFLRRADWTTLGGMDRRFKSPGGGLVNLDTLEQAMKLPDAKMIMLLGEATFHQFHGGVSTNANVERQLENWDVWKAERDKFRGADDFSFHRPSEFVGSIPAALIPHLTRSAIATSDRFTSASGPGSIPELFMGSEPSLQEPTAQKLFDLAKSQFVRGQYQATADILRLAIARAPSDLAASPMMSAAVCWARKKVRPPKPG